MCLGSLLGESAAGEGGHFVAIVKQDPSLGAQIAVIDLGELQKMIGGHAETLDFAGNVAPSARRRCCRRIRARRWRDSRGVCVFRVSCVLCAFCVLCVMFCVWAPTHVGQGECLACMFPRWASSTWRLLCPGAFAALAVVFGDLLGDLGDLADPVDLGDFGCIGSLGGVDASPSLGALGSPGDDAAGHFDATESAEDEMSFLGAEVDGCRRVSKIKMSCRSPCPAQAQTRRYIYIYMYIPRHLYFGRV